MGELDVEKLANDLAALVPQEHRDFAAKLLADHGVPELPSEDQGRTNLLGWTAATAATAAPTGDAVARGHRYATQANDVMFNPVGQVVSQMTRVRKVREVIETLVEEYLEACDRINRINNAML